MLAASATSLSAATDTLSPAAPSAPPPTSPPFEFETLVKGLPPTLCDSFTINPQMIYTADRQLADLILADISSRPERDIYSKRSAWRQASGVKLLGILYAECDNLNSGPQNMIVDEIHAMSARGFEFATTAGFADYREQMCALNNSLGVKLRSN